MSMDEKDQTNTYNDTQFSLWVEIEDVEAANNHSKDNVTDKEEITNLSYTGVFE